MLPALSRDYLEKGLFWNGFKCVLGRNPLEVEQVHEEDDVCIQTEEEIKYCKLIVVYVGLERGETIDEQFEMLNLKGVGGVTHCLFKSVISLKSLPTGPVNSLGPISASSLRSSLQTQATTEGPPPVSKRYFCVTKLQHKVDTLRKRVHESNANYVIAYMNHTKQLKYAILKLEAHEMKAAKLLGDLDKFARLTTLKKFQNEEVRVLVTNELSARGLDMFECGHVVNLYLPTNSIHYAH